MAAMEMALIAIAGVLFFALACIQPYFAKLNQRVRRWVIRHRSLKARPLMAMTHRYNDVLSLSLQVLIIAILVAWLGQDFQRALWLVSVMFVQTTIVSLSKRLTSIARPPQQFAHVIMRSSSYPSGHAAASMTFAFLVPTVLMPHLPASLVFGITGYLFLVALITAYGRLYLDVHWLTDIVGGWLLSFILLRLSRFLLLSML